MVVTSFFVDSTETTAASLNRQPALATATLRHILFVKPPRRARAAINAVAIIARAANKPLQPASS